MKPLYNRLITTPTFISLACVIIFIVSIPWGIYSYKQADPSTEGWVLTFLLFLYLGIGMLFGIDNFLVKYINHKKLTFYEILTVMLVAIIFVFNSRKVFLDFQHKKTEFVILIENPGNLINSQLIDSTLFDKKINVSKNVLIFDKISSNIKLSNTPPTWDQGFYYNNYSFKKYKKVKLYWNPALNLDKRINDRFIDSLLNLVN